MEKFIKEYIEPIKNSYILFGALITLFVLLQTAFTDLITADFLQGMVLFVILLVSLSLLYNTFIISREKRTSATFILYWILLGTFIVCLFGSIYLKFSKTFMIFLGLTLGIFLATFFVSCRFYFIIFQKNRKFKKLWRILFCISAFIILNYASNYYSPHQNHLNELIETESLNKISEEDWFYFSFFPLPILFLWIMWIMSIVDIFRKEPLYAENYIWNKSKLYKLITKIKQKGLKEFLFPMPK